jgi:hypothetical protein
MTDNASRLLLLDLDGVLLTPRGYHASLQETVRIVGRSLGFSGVHLSQETIDLFEAAGVTAEWDSSAICACLLLQRLWSVDPQARLPGTSPSPTIPLHGLPLPDLRGFAETMHAQRSYDRNPLERAEALLLERSDGLDPEQTGHLGDLLRNARSPDASLTHRLVQELNLGSERFRQLYGLEPLLACQSALEQSDKPTLSPAALRRLRAWLEPAERGAAIFTNRPSVPPDGSFGSPEAELGARVAGLGDLPIVALGALAWLGARRGEPLEAYLKPSPVHALAALRCAQGEPVAAAVQTAADLALEGKFDPGWRRLEGAVIYALEDGARGLRSVRTAADVLRSVGIKVDVTALGVTGSPAKAASLEQEGAIVLPTNEAAFDQVKGF